MLRETNKCTISEAVMRAMRWKGGPQLWGWKVGRGIQGGFTMKMIYDQNLEGAGSVP